MLGFPLAALVVTAIAVLDPPLALTPMFDIWPLMSAAAFLRRREVLVTYGSVVADELLAAADAALYRAKHAGRNAVRAA